MMDKTVPAKCPYCGCGNILVERSLEGYCRCHRCKETFIDKTLPLKLIIKDIEAELAAAKAELEAEREKVKILTKQINSSIIQCACGEYGLGNPCKKCSDKKMKQLDYEATFWENKAEQATANKRQHVHDFDWKETRR